MHSRLDPLLTPRSVAIVGASERNHHGKQALDSLERLKFTGPAYLVNPARQEVWGRPCFPDLRSTPGVPQLAILVVNRDRVLQVVQQCAEAGVKALVINTDGFGESADAYGQELQQQLVALVRRNGMLLCGPNCLGMLNFHGAAAAYCGPIREPVELGNISFISQSGGNTALFIELAHARNLGLSYVVSTGNEADLDTCDYLEHVIDDPNTQVTCLLLESIRNPRRFMALATRSTRIGKPVIAVKIGRSPAARVAAIAHTGALTGSDDAVNALFTQAGVLRAATLDEAIDQAALFSLMPPARWLNGPRLAVFTVGGGLAGLFSDLALDRGLEVPPLPASIKTSLAPFFPANVSIHNPFDCPGSYVNDKPQVAANFVRECAASPDFDAVVMLRAVSGTKSLEYLEPLAGIPEEVRKPVLVSSTIDAPMQDYKRTFMAGSKLTFVTGLPRLLTGLTAMVRFRHMQRALPDLVAPGHSAIALSERSRRDLEAFAAEGRTVLPHSATYALMEEFGIRAVPQQEVWGVEQAVAFAKVIGYPVVAKLVNSDALTHKTELGAIHVNLRSEAELTGAMVQLLALMREKQLMQEGRPVPVLVQKMVQPAMEIFLGATVPSGDYPPMVLVGAGGILVEVMRDVVRHIAPLSISQAIDMIGRLKVHPLLTGYRGGARSDVPALAQTIVRLGDLIAATEHCISDVDLNPILVQPEGQGAWMVDAVVALKSPGAEP